MCIPRPTMRRSKPGVSVAVQSLRPASRVAELFSLGVIAPAAMFHDAETQNSNPTVPAVA